VAADFKVLHAQGVAALAGRALRGALCVNKTEARTDWQRARAPYAEDNTVDGRGRPVNKGRAVVLARRLRPCGP